MHLNLIPKNMGHLEALNQGGEGGQQAGYIERRGFEKRYGKLKIGSDRPEEEERREHLYLRLSNSFPFDKSIGTST